jgi:hypothetical protein
MKFDKSLARKKLPKGIGEQRGGPAVQKFLKHHTSIHNHYDLGLDFLKTDFFKSIQKTLDPKNKTTWDGARPRFLELRDEQVEIQKGLEIKNHIEEKDIFSLLTNLSYHITVENPLEPDVIRFRLNCWEDVEITLTQLEEAFEVLNTIEKYQDDPETGGFVYKYWNKLTSDLWACCQGGLHEEGLYLVKVLKDLILKIDTYSKAHGKLPNNCVFKGVLDQQTLGRFLKTLWMGEAKIYESLGETEKMVECYEEIGKLFCSDKYPLESTLISGVHWFTGQTRVIEALIQVYKHKPSNELKEKIIGCYIDSCKFYEYEPTESVRERGIITYMLAKYVLKMEIK